MDVCYVISLVSVSEKHGPRLDAVLRVKRNLDDAIEYVAHNTNVPASAIKKRWSNGFVNVYLNDSIYTIEENALE